MTKVRQLGPIRPCKKVVCLDKISVITNSLQVRMGLSRIDKYWPKRTNLQTNRRQNLSQVKTGQNRLNKQNFVYLVIHMS